MALTECFEKDLRMDEFVPHFIIPCTVFYFLNCLPAAGLNTMVLSTIWKNTSLHSPSKILLCSLSLTDLILGFLSQMLFALYCISALNHWEYVFCVTWMANRRLGYCLVSISLQTLTLMSVDRYLAITTKTAYKSTVTKRRVLLLLLITWIGSILSVLGGIEFFNLNILSNMAGGLLMICLVIIIFTFSAAFTKLRKLSRQAVQDSNSQESNQTSFNIGKYRSSLITMVMILALTFLSYVPVGIVIIIKTLTSNLRGVAIYLVHSGQILVFLSSTVNPIFYIWRTADLRSAVKQNVLAIKAKMCC